MIILIISIIVWIALMVLIYVSSDYDRWFSTLFVGGLGGGIAISLLTFLFFLPMTTGLYKNYAQLEQVGYLTNLSKKGIIWKTWEGEMQKGVGEQTSVENHFSFSATNESVVNELKRYLGDRQRIKVYCRQWLSMPFKRGSTSKEVMKVEKIQNR